MMSSPTAAPRKNGWQPVEIEQLLCAVEHAASGGEPLRRVFTRMGDTLGRKPNSVRNFYYARCRESDAPRVLPFETFTDAEVRDLVRDVLRGRAAGESVRACVLRRAEGDRTRMLRYQNKYRSVFKNRPELIREIAEELRSEGVEVPSVTEESSLPEAPVAQTAHALLPAPVAPTASTEPWGAALSRIERGMEALLQAQESRRAPQLEIDRMQVRQDLLRIELADAQRDVRALREAMAQASLCLRMQPMTAELSACADLLDSVLQATLRP